MGTTRDDAELATIKQIIDALSPLEPEAQGRVVDYVFQRLGIERRAPSATPTPEHVIAHPGAPQSHASPPAPSHPIDIRTLTAEKQPSTANEMAAVVAYYLKELASMSERKDEINADDIEKYFKQAQFRLPKVIGQTLLNAKNAGYLDPGSQRGSFRLNPVGHNLVVHGLPGETRGAAPAKSAQRKSNKKKATTKKKGKRAR